ncbi:ribokinase [Lichenibacterium dinghuense]|uniref:ribokinase n=1 Tax=Lichenibacterium dinghuense TaxID=2895977 RepID=UPI001F3C5352|nr:ribokinase [Lichenibacterium sp. 6Y81]
MIAVFGSVNIDLVTAVERIAAPGETVMGGSYRAIPGGKGANQALAARRAGAETVLVGAVGRDGFAEPALALLRQAGVDLAGVAAVDAPTGAAFIAVDADGANAITVAAGANAEAQAAQLDALPANGGLLLLQREVPDREGEAAARAARARGLRTVLNLAPSGRVPDGFLALVDVMVVNEHEAADLAGFLGLPDDHAGLAAHLRTRFGVGATVVTLGAEGAVGWEGGAEHRAPCPRVLAVDTTAAGDSFVGFFAAALDAGLPFGEAMRRGTAAGSLACTTAGAQPSIPDAAAVDALLARSAV